MQCFKVQNRSQLMGIYCSFTGIESVFLNYPAGSVIKTVSCAEFLRVALQTVAGG